jgi:hypothetical protein
MSRETAHCGSALQDAVWRDRKLRILYGDDECPSERILDPLGLVAKGSIWYLVARVGEDIRSYRVSRVREARILDETFLRPLFDLEAFWKNSAAQFKDRLPRFAVVVRTSSIHWLRTMMRYGAIDTVDGDVVHLHFDAPEVAKTVLLGLADQVEILEPASLREAVVEAARNLLRDFAKVLDERRIDAGEKHLRVGCVDDSAAHEVCRAAGDVGDARRNQAAGARLGDRYGLFALDEHPPDHRFEGVAVEAVNFVTKYR